jgi:transcriptional regulator with XRE-family HTH domain
VTDFPFILQELRRRLKLSQGALSAHLGTGRISVNRWENGAYPPRRMTIKVVRDFAADQGFSDLATTLDGFYKGNPLKEERIAVLKARKKEIEAELKLLGGKK